MTNTHAPLPMGTAAEQEQAVEELVRFGSHAGLDQATADRLMAPFGRVARLHREIANDPRNPKGLWRDDLPPKSPVLVVGGWELADQMASALGVRSGTAMGRGFRFRETVANLFTRLGRDRAGLTTTREEG